MTRSVVYTADEWLTSKRRMASVVVVDVREVCQGIGAFGIAGIRAYGRVRFSLHLAVRLRTVGPGVFVDDASRARHLTEQPGSVAGAVVVQDAFDGDAVLGEEGVRVPSERGGGLLALVRQDLAVCE